MGRFVGLIFDTCGQPLFTPTWTGMRSGFLFPIFTLVLIGVRQRSFSFGASE
jgi:hypothetical protein